MLNLRKLIREELEKIFEGVDEDTLRRMADFGVDENDIDVLGYITLYHGGKNLPETLRRGEIFFMSPYEKEAEMYVGMRGGKVFQIKVKPEDVNWNTGSGEIEFVKGGEIVDLGDGSYKLFPDS